MNETYSERAKEKWPHPLTHTEARESRSSWKTHCLVSRIDDVKGKGLRVKLMPL